MTITRRDLLAGILSAGVAPVFVPFGSLMKPPPMILPPERRLWLPFDEGGQAVRPGDRLITNSLAFSLTQSGTIDGIWLMSDGSYELGWLD